MITPSPGLREHVAARWVRHGAGPLPPSLPEPAVDLLVMPGRGLWLAGAEQVARQGELPPGGKLIGFRLRPGACSAWLWLAADEIPLGGAPIEDLMGTRDARALEAGRLEPRREPDALMLRVVRAMAARPELTVAEHAELACLSERQLRRRFGQAVGLGPKAYLRVTRLHRAVESARESLKLGKPPRWADIAARHGFYDQPHLLAEFRRAAGCLPDALADGRFLQATAAPPSSRSAHEQH
ncbi:AraC-type DNA-binding protein [Amycolatopsis xylanica]|uniref:AraC-type DNA-binding protein n=1 Tax=Amycolatopsis xylanica TaxID=589385 RepID=A0A1H3TA09_9PSEU|nr:helix-turn-helix transcriptional regulator [Amycolatopsis xylanica]SDZ47076.1 AraC-type DNA-binding protein [Amycolatopsis xylanica]